MKKEKTFAINLGPERMSELVGTITLKEPYAKMFEERLCEISYAEIEEKKGDVRLVGLFLGMMRGGK